MSDFRPDSYWDRIYFISEVGCIYISDFGSQKNLSPFGFKLSPFPFPLQIAAFFGFCYIFRGAFVNILQAQFNAVKQPDIKLANIHSPLFFRD
jgi:hypothetical protein